MDDCKTEAEMKQNELEYLKLEKLDFHITRTSVDETDAVWHMNSFFGL